MKKRTIILAMLAAMLMVTSDFTVNILHAEEMQTEEIRTAAETEETSQLPIKALSPKVVTENPYMAKAMLISIMTATTQTALTRYCRLIFIQRSMFRMRK